MDKPPHELEPQWLVTLKYWWPIALVAVVTRLVRYREHVARNRQKFWRMDLIWEVVMAGLCAVVADGIATRFDLDRSQAIAATTIISWVGLKGLQALLFGGFKSGSSKGI